MTEPPYDATDMVDWDFAVATGKRFVRPGPEVSRQEAAEIVAELRVDAKAAEGHVRAYTGMHSEEAAESPVAVVGREGWVEANAEGFRELMRPLVDKMAEKRGASMVPSSIGSRITGFEAGALLGYLAGKVLGQYDPFWPGDDGAEDGAAGDGTTGGRLLLVAPNIVHVERQLEVDPRDFRLWVCLHEETHRVQFTAVPWLREHLHGEIQELVDATSLDPADMAAMAKDGLEQAIRIARGDEGVSIIDLFQSPEQRQIIDRITAAMSLLEGHADVVMDGVGPSVIPSVQSIRSKFDKRRRGGGTLDQLLRRLLGFDAKMRQYRDGAAFVRGVIDEVGMERFNTVWTSPETLPTKLEVGDPIAWVRRVGA